MEVLMMKKFLIGTAAVLFVIFVGFFSHNWLAERAKAIDTLINPDHEKVEDARGILDKVLEHIAETSPELSLIDGELVNSELGLPVFEVLPISEITHFDEQDIVDGHIVRPIVTVENPRLLIIIEAVDKDAAVRTKDAMAKVLSDQHAEFADGDVWTRHLIDDNETERQGNFLIYATWDDAKELVKVFQRHVQ